MIELVDAVVKNNNKIKTMYLPRHGSLNSKLVKYDYHFSYDLGEYKRKKLAGWAYIDDINYNYTCVKKIGNYDNVAVLIKNEDLYFVDLKSKTFIWPSIVVNYKNTGLCTFISLLSFNERELYDGKKYAVSKLLPPLEGEAARSDIFQRLNKTYGEKMFDNFEDAYRHTIFMHHINFNIDNCRELVKQVGLGELTIFEALQSVDFIKNKLYEEGKDLKINIGELWEESISDFYNSYYS